MNLVINPNKGIGNIEFGMTRSEVRVLMDCDFESVRKAPWNESLIDCYESEFIQFGYNENDRLQFIELLPGNNAILLDIKLNKHNVKQLLKKIKIKGFAVSVDKDDESYLFEDICFGIHGNGKNVQTCFLWGGISYDSMLEMETKLMDDYYKNKSR